MGSLVIFKTDTKELVTCLKDAQGTTFYKDDVCVGMGLDPEEYTGVRLEDSLNRYEFRDNMVIEADGSIRHKHTFTPAIDKFTVQADGSDTVTISGLPIPCSVTVNGQTVTVDDGTLELTFDLPGDYPVKLTADGYIPLEVVIHAT